MAAAAGRLPARGRRRAKIKKADAGPAPDRADPEPRHPGRTGARPSGLPPGDWSASPPRPATRPATVLDHARAKLARKGCDLLVVNEVGDGQGVRAARQRRRRSSAPTAAERRRRLGPKTVLAAADLGRRSPARLRPLDCRCPTRRSDDRPSAAVSLGEDRDPPPVHLGIRHRGTPGQDRRPDQRRDPGRAARRRTRAAGSPSRR